jgi:ferredoxin
MDKTEIENLINVEIMGKRYRVPEGISVVQAYWYTGHEAIRGIGCLGGVCGACSTAYRTRNNYELKTGLGCQLLVEEGMSFSLVPNYPVHRATYHLEEIRDPKQELFKYFPEASMCRNCNACTEACPQGINVREGLWKTVFGDFEGAANEFMSCVMCGLCVPVYIADIASNQVGLYARRTFGVFYAKRPERLKKRIQEIENGKYESEWKKILELKEEELRARCATHR